MTSAMAQKIGVTLSAFEHQFLVNVRQAMTEKAKELGVEIQFVEAQGDIGKQLSQIQNFITQKMDAIIVNPVDTTATPKMTQLVTEAKIPLVYVNLQPAEETLPKGAAYVGSPEVTSGKLQGEAIAKLLITRATSSSWWASLRPRLPFCGLKASRRSWPNIRR